MTRVRGGGTAGLFAGVLLLGACGETHTREAAASAIASGRDDAGAAGSAAPHDDAGRSGSAAPRDDGKADGGPLEAAGTGLDAGATFGRDADVPDAGSAPPPVAITCPVAGDFASTTPDACVATPAIDGTPCDAPQGTTCIRYEYAQGASEPSEVCGATCWPTPARTEWSYSCVPCRRDCREPSPDTPVYELDASDCASRPVTPCLDWGVTAQSELDGTLRALVNDLGVDLFEISEDSLVVHFAGGCPTRFHAAAFQRPLTDLAAALSGPLGQVRWECAELIDCAAVQGPSTLAAE